VAELSLLPNNWPGEPPDAFQRDRMTPNDLPFTGPTFLAPMEGVTESCFRDLVLRRNPAHLLGGAFTEFARVVAVPLPRKTIQSHLGPERHTAPVGLQLMGQRDDALAESARIAEGMGVPLVDLNFGCPAKGALRSCAGAALLDDPRRMEELVRACVDAVQSIPVTAKIRAGGEDDSNLEEIARAVEAGGASLLTVHCRTREERYRGNGDWERLRRAVAAVDIPVCGNGGIDSHADIGRIIAETGCSYVMVGRAALADPWIFSGETASREEALRFLLDYADLLIERDGSTTMKVVGRLKQLIRHWRAGGLFDGEREWWLGQRDPQVVLDKLRAISPRPE
jgi:nifR3 family TIM-barrel protein